MYKNVVSQNVSVYAYNATTLDPSTSDAANITAYISKDGGAATQSNDTNPTELHGTNMPGVYTFDLTQTESNCDHFVLKAESSTSNIVIDPVQEWTRPVYTQLDQDNRNYNVICKALIGFDKTVVLPGINTVMQDIEAWTNGAFPVAKAEILSDLYFRMVDVDDFMTGITGIAATMTCEVSKDDGAFAGCTNTPTEIASGVYTIDLTAIETNANSVCLKCTHSTAIPVVVALRPQ